MNLRPVAHLVGFVLVALGLAMAGCAAVGLAMGDGMPATTGLALAAALTLAAGWLGARSARGIGDLTRGQGVAVVALGWLAATAFGGLPYALALDGRAGALDAFFESVSGFTTTGASVFADVESMPRGVVLWRATTCLFGGMGILVLCVAVLPLLGQGGMQLYRAESSGVAGDRLTPRIASTAKALWGLYLLLNALLIAALRLGGMPLFDAVCHSFAAIATAGFSTRNTSIAAYDSLYVEMVLVVFLFLSATNFSLLYRALRGDVRGYLRDSEFRFFAGWWAAACLAVAWLNWGPVYASPLASLRAAVFTVTSLSSTCGFCTDDFDRWTTPSRMILVGLMLAGGCGGSTAGAIKQIRILVTLKLVGREMRRFLRPQAVVPLRISGEPVAIEAALPLLLYVALYLITFLALGALLTLFTDPTTAFSSVATTMGGVGPGLGLAGSTEVYAGFAAPMKATLIACMLLGRLEFYALLVLVAPSLWRR